MVTASRLCCLVGSGFLRLLSRIARDRPCRMLPNAIAILGRIYSPGQRKEMALQSVRSYCAGWFCNRCSYVVLDCREIVVAVGILDYGNRMSVSSPTGTVVLSPEGPRAENSDGGLPWYTRLDILGSATGVTGLVFDQLRVESRPCKLGGRCLLHLKRAAHCRHSFSWPIRTYRASGNAAIASTIPVYERASLGIGLRRSRLVELWDIGRLLLPVHGGNQRGFGALDLCEVVRRLGIWCHSCGNHRLHYRPRSALLHHVASNDSPCRGPSAAQPPSPADQIYWAQAFVIVIITPWGM